MFLGLDLEYLDHLSDVRYSCINTLRPMLALRWPCLPGEAWVGGSAAREEGQVEWVTIPNPQKPASK